MEDFESPFDGDNPDEGTSLEDITLVDGPKVYITRGKYRGLLLPKMLHVKPEKQEKVEAIKRSIIYDEQIPKHATVLAREYAAIRKEKEELKALLSECELRLEAVSQMLADQFEVEDIYSLTSENKANVRVQPEPHTVVMNKEEFRIWCVEAKLERLMCLPWATANKLVKDRLLGGLPEPKGVQAHFRNKIVFKKGET